MNKYLRAIAAGAMIGIAGAIYLAVGPPWGAVLFSIGLMIICNRGFNLYTGKIGYIQKPKEILDMLIYICGNAIGTLIVAATQNVNTTEMVAAKLAMPWWLTLVKAIGCGFLMYIAVDTYKIKQNYWGIITCIPAFILAGFEHSIADMFYIYCSDYCHWGNIGWDGNISWDAGVFIIIVIIGNAIGANIHHLDKLKKL